MKRRPRKCALSFAVSPCLLLLISNLYIGGPGVALVFAQSQNPTPPRPAGMATGGARAPVKDALSRPITVGGFVDGAPVVFADITKQAGLDKFHHRSGTPEKS